MRRITMCMLFLLCSASIATAEVYTWTDEQGVVIFTDNPARIPSHYNRMQMGEDGIIRISAVQKKIRITERKMLQSIIPSNRHK